jgi:hypothetical protein
MKTTAEIVAERPEWLLNNLRNTLAEKRTAIFLRLCAVMTANQAKLFMALAEEALAIPAGEDE